MSDTVTQLLLCKEYLAEKDKHIAALESENRLLKSNLENANENWRRVLEERDRMITIIKEADLNVDWRM